MIRSHVVDYRAQEDAPDRWRLFDRGFWIHGLPRCLLLCRALGHKPVVDGTGEAGKPGHMSRWVVCDRCGTRPSPQGRLDPAQWNVGEPYTGPWSDTPNAPAAVTKKLRDLGDVPPEPRLTPPGLWPTTETWTFGGQAIIGKNIPGASIEIKVGNRASEEPLAAHLRLHPLGALYLHTGDLGRGIQRRLNPTGYESRVIGLDIGLGALSWKLWAKRDSDTESDPHWQQGSIELNPITKLFGQKRYWYTDRGDPVTTTVRLPHGDDHIVELQLQRRDFGRPKLHRRFDSWTVDWNCKGGIPTKPGDRGRITASGVDVSDSAVREGTWPLEASAAIASQITQDRARYGVRVSGAVA